MHTHLYSAASGRHTRVGGHNGDGDGVGVLSVDGAVDEQLSVVGVDVHQSVSASNRTQRGRTRSGEDGGGSAAASEC